MIPVMGRRRVVSDEIPALWPAAPAAGCARCPVTPRRPSDRRRCGTVAMDAAGAQQVGVRPVTAVVNRGSLVRKQANIWVFTLAIQGCHSVHVPEDGRYPDR
jgi:hypothetical protein